MKKNNPRKHKSHGMGNLLCYPLVFVLITVVLTGCIGESGLTETDPVFQDSPASRITMFDITSWDDDQVGGGGGGNPFDQDLNTTDDVTFNLINSSCGNSTEWCNAYSWGDHSVAGYDTTNDTWAMNAGNVYTNDNVGINDNTPGYPLEVVGNVKLSGNVGISASPNSKYGIYSLFNLPTTTQSTGMFNWIYTPTVNDGTGNNLQYYAYWNRFAWNSPLVNMSSNSDLRSMMNNARIETGSSGNPGNMKGIHNYLWASGGHGNLSNFYCGYYDAVGTGSWSGSIDNVYGLYVDEMIPTSGTFNNTYAILTEAGDVVFNENGGDNDFRVESDNNTNMLFVDGGNDFVGIGTNNPGYIFHIEDSSSVMTYIETTQVNGYSAVAMKNDNQEWRYMTQTNDNFVVFDNNNAKIPFMIFPNSPTNSLRINTGELIINENSQNYDFRVESDGQSDMFFVDGGNDRVGIGTNNPSSILEVEGTTMTEILQLDNLTSAPGTPADGMIVYADGTSWNPGAGQGIYAYYNGGWNKL